MMTDDAHPPFPYPAGFGAPGRRPGIAARPLGIVWAESTKRSLDDLSANAPTFAAPSGPVEILAIQSANLQRAGARGAARSPMIADQIAALTADLPRPPPAPSTARAQ